jgi:uncharacterized phiE125 gp8 family phage protein
MALVRVLAPAIEPLTLAEVLAHLRLDDGNVEPVPGAPSVALALAGAGNVDNGSHRYRVTFVTADGETDGGQISSAIAVIDKTTNGKVALTDIPTGGAAVEARKIYRTGANGADFFLVATIPNNATTTYVDNVADAALGAGVPTANSTGDPLLQSLIVAAREVVEGLTNHALITQTQRLSLQAFPCGDVISLEAHPVQSIESFTYVDAAGASVPFVDYTLDRDSFPARVVLNYGKRWPSTRASRNAIAITMKVGFGDTAADVPSRIRAAMKLLIGSWYENREAVNVGNIVTTMPMAVEALLSSYRRPAMEMA